MSKHGIKRIKNKTEKKTKFVQIRVTNIEKLELETKARAAGVSISEMILTSAKKMKTWTAKDRKIEQAKIYELARIRNNMNQIVQFCTTYKHTVDATDILICLMSMGYQKKGMFVNRTLDLPSHGRESLG